MVTFSFYIAILARCLKCTSCWMPFGHLSLHNSDDSDDDVSLKEDKTKKANEKEVPLVIYSLLHFTHH